MIRGHFQSQVECLFRHKLKDHQQNHSLLSQQVNYTITSKVLIKFGEKAMALKKKNPPKRIPLLNCFGKKEFNMKKT